MPLQSWGSLLDEAGDVTFDVLPDADYNVKVEKANPKMAGSGNLMFELTLVVTSGPYAKRKLWTNVVVAPGNQVALNIFFRKMHAMGIAKEFFGANPSDSQVAEAMVGREFRAQVGNKMYQGEKRNEVKGFAPVSATAAAGSPAVPPPPSIPTPSTPGVPVTAGAGVAPAPAPPAPAAAAAPPAPAPVPESAPAAPIQPATPPVPDTPAPVAEAAPVAPPLPPAPPTEAAPAAAPQEPQGATPPAPPF